MTRITSEEFTADDDEIAAAEAKAKAKARANANGGAQHQRFQLIPFDEMKVNLKANYVVKGLIPAGGLTVIWGPPKCGKSFLATDIGLHIALTRVWRGRRVKGGPVVYCAMEGAAGYGARMEAFRRRHLNGETNIPFYLLTSPMKLVCDHGELIKAIRHTLGDVPPVTVFLDTLNRSIGGSESDDRDMANYIAAADAVRDFFTCTMGIIHHCGVDGSRPRGHTSLTGAADAQLAVKRDAQNIILTIEAMKDGPGEGDQIISRLEPVEVGLDEDGEPITSCVIVPVDGTPATAKKLTDRQKLALNALTECILTRGKDLPPELGLPAGLKAVAMDEWREEIYARARRLPAAPAKPGRQFSHW